MERPAGEVLGPAEPCRKGYCPPSAVRASSGRLPAAACRPARGRWCTPGRRRWEVAGRGQGQADDAALGGRVGDLPDLPVVGRDRGGVDDDAALAVLVRLGRGHGGGGQPQHVEGADQVDRDRRSRRAEVVRVAVAGRRCAAPSRCRRSIDRRCRSGRSLPVASATAAWTDASSVTSVRTKVVSPPSSAASACAAVLLQVEDRSRRRPWRPVLGWWPRRARRLRLPPARRFRSAPPATRSLAPRGRRCARARATRRGCRRAGRWTPRPRP